MDSNKYKHWVFTWIYDFTDEDLLSLESFLKSICTSYAFQKELGETTNKQHLQGYFCLKIRKRHGTVLSAFSTFCEEKTFDTKCLTIQRMMGTQEEAIAYCTKTDTQIGEPRLFGFKQQYKASDLQLFSKENNWYPWQVELNKELFKNDLTIKKPDDRTIIWVHDAMGNSGKSKYVKHICYKFPDEACKVAFGSSNQLRSAVITAESRLIYFIDIPRTLGKEDRILDIISVIEDIKNGFVVTAMYGKYAQMMFDPPHVVVFSNMFAPQNTLSNDRLKTYEIDYDKTMRRVHLN